MKRKTLQLFLRGAVLSALFLAGCVNTMAEETVAEEAVTEEAVTEEDTGGEAVTEEVSEEEAVTGEVDAEEEGAEAETEEPEDEDYTTGDAMLDDVRNQDEIGDKEILVVSFGTSFNDNRRETIGAIESAIADAFPEWSVRRAFTAQIIIDHVERRDGIHIDNVQEALDRAADNGVKILVVQPTHLMAGLEYEELEETLAEYADVMDIYLGANLLDTDESFAQVETAIVEATSAYDDGETAIIFMGHGTEAESNGVYSQMQERLTEDGYDNYFVGTVEAEPSLEDVIAAIDDRGYKKAVLRPLMVVAGDHAHNDMAAEDDPESWYSILTSEGYEVTSILEGLGQLPAVQQMYVEHVQETLDAFELS